MAVNKLNQLILFHRKKAKLSRADLANLAGVGKTVIYDLENGKETVKWTTVISVLNALNISVEFDSPLMEVYAKSSSSDA